MSADRNLRSEDQFRCSICLDLFTDPVSTSCGHNFCKTCISQNWNSNVMYNCPLCKEQFKTRPQLKVNTLLRELVDQIRHEAQQAAEPGEVRRKKAELRNTEAEVQKMIHNRRLKIQVFKESLKISKAAADKEKTEGLQVFTDLMDSVERNKKNFMKEMVDKQKTTEKQTEDFIKDLEQEISELMKRSSELKQLSCSEDHLHLLQNFSSLKAVPPTKNWTQVRVVPQSYEGTMVRAVAKLEEELRRKMKKMFEAELKRVQKFEVDLTLDPETAHPALILSDDGKQVHHSYVRKKLPDNPERFSKCVSVLGTQSFSSGRFYFQVQVKGKTDWAVGVVRKSINRKGNIKYNPQIGFWIIGLRNGNQYTAALGPGVDLSLQSGPEKVGVFVDYQEGLVSFYDVDAAALIYSFTGCCFTKELYPYFGPGLNDGGKNSAPQIICPVNQSA